MNNNWFQKIYDAILGFFSGGSQSPGVEQAPGLEETPGVEQSEVNPEPNPEPTVNLDQSQMKEYFLDLSVALTGFSKFDLQGTGQAEAYYSKVENKVDQEIFQELLQTFHDQSISAILGSKKFDAIARNITKLWYVATWYPLAESGDEASIVSPQAYPEGLLWRSIGVNPPGAKAPGYGTWAEKPTVTLD